MDRKCKKIGLCFSFAWAFGLSFVAMANPEPIQAIENSSPQPAVSSNSPERKDPIHTVLKNSGALASSLMPKYGNWCGADYPKDIQNADAPIGLLDSACMRHDFCYQDQGYLNCQCDKVFNAEVVAGLLDKKFHGKEYVLARSFRIYFQGSPCAGDHADKIAPSRAVHNLIKNVGTKALQVIDALPFVGE